jgi:rubrerythrin
LRHRRAAARQQSPTSCRECGKYYEGKPSFCPHCGKPVLPST